MAGERLLVVEDERIVSEDLQDMLKRLGYDIVGSATSGEEAVRKAEELQPDLILMDIRMKGELDGIQAAEIIWTRHNIPVTYLTAYADESTLERAKATLPFGYILKPFEERDLRTTIEIALYKHQMDATLGRIDDWHAGALESLSDPVIATNSQGHITFMNAAAEALTGWPLRQVYGKSLRETFAITSPPVGDALQRVIGRFKMKDGREVVMEYAVNPLKDEADKVSGEIFLLHPAAVGKESRSAI